MKTIRPAGPLPALMMLAAASVMAGQQALAAVIGTTGNIVLETSPYPPESDTQIFVFDEQQAVPFVASQSLDFGSIAAGTLVNSHYIQYDTESGSGSTDGGIISFDGPVLAVITSTEFLDEDLSADGAGTSDSYFGLADTLGPYPTGANAGARGLGSPEDDLMVSLGSTSLTIESLQIPGSGANNLDGIRVLTAVIPVPGAVWLFASALGLLGWLRRETGADRDSSLQS